MPEWLDPSLWRQALAPWRFELLLAATIMSLADYVTTTMFVRRAGPELESNRLLRWIMERYGIRGLWTFWAIVWTIVWFGGLFGASTLAVLTLMHGAAVINNLFVLRSLAREDYAEA
ncbi:hypothetical protein [Erythrobacter sp. WG]|uniref:hypothetical protein n=1 Tax=Erythrobacter sp. WG TaxID=2985510 RepID=UPI00226FC530|nr:hypothetical protein [Erythrobacter sp. WG]MCX9148014.1 hypothetical protein [Erythrobacter sp. WG]